MKQAVNPYLPSWEYVPDVEPHVFGDRVYVYGSHDKFNGHVYCLNDYVCYSAPVDDLADWRYEGVIYKKQQDPLNPDGAMCLYAPDVTIGPDGRYYLYYVLDKVSVVSVAVADTPSGPFDFYGYVQDASGHRLGEREGDQPQFDPGVLTEGNQTYLYTGFCPVGDASRLGAMVTVLKEDMVTIETEPQIIAPSEPYSEGSSFNGHEFFEAPSMRKVNDTYYFIYSSIVFHELCYATSQSPTSGFTYQGVIVSNNDIGIETYKEADTPMYYGGNNHGSIVDINNQWFIFYHRHTNGSNFSRQGCIEPIDMKDGKIDQVEITSSGPNLGPLKGDGTYPAYIACHLFGEKETVYTGDLYLDPQLPRIKQEGKDGEEEAGYVENLTHQSTCGFKYFDITHVNTVAVTTRGYGKGVIQVRTSPTGEVHGEIPIDFTNVWTTYQQPIALPEGKQSLYFTFNGQGRTALKQFSLGRN